MALPQPRFLRLALLTLVFPPPHPFIPAEAGIQGRARWIPAFARRTSLGHAVDETLDYAAPILNISLAASLSTSRFSASERPGALSITCTGPGSPMLYG